MARVQQPARGPERRHLARSRSPSRYRCGCQSEHRNCGADGVTITTPPSAFWLSYRQEEGALPDCPLGWRASGGTQRSREVSRRTTRVQAGQNERTGQGNLLSSKCRALRLEKCRDEEGMPVQLDRTDVPLSVLGTYA